MEWSTTFDQNGWLEYPENSACNFQAGTKVTSSTVLLLQELLFNATLRLTQGFKCPMLTPWVSASAVSASAVSAINVSLAVPGMVWLAAMVWARAHSCVPWRNVMVRGTQVDLFPQDQQLFVGCCGTFAAIILAFFPILSLQNTGTSSVSHGIPNLRVCQQGPSWLQAKVVLMVPWRHFFLIKNGEFLDERIAKSSYYIITDI